MNDYDDVVQTIRDAKRISGFTNQQLADAANVPQSTVNKLLRQVLAPDFIVIALMSVLASSYILIDLYFWAMNGLGICSNVAQTFVYSLLLLSAAPYLFGKVTAVLSRYLHRFDRNNTACHVFP